MKLSRLTLGTAQLGMNYGINNKTGMPEYEESKKIIDLALESGITSFDTAPVYGNSEKILGEFLKNYKEKENLTIISKMPKINWKQPPNKIESFIEKTFYKSLENLKIKSISIYLFHNEEDISKKNNFALRKLIYLKKKGYLKQIGVSIYSPENALKFLEFDDLEVIQVPFNLIDRRLIQNSSFTKAKSKGKIILVRSIFLQGLFFKDKVPEKLKNFLPIKKQIEKILKESELSMQELAIRFVLNYDFIDSIILGVETLKQLKENIAIFKKGKLERVLQNKLINLNLNKINNIILNPSLWNLGEK